MHSIWTVEPLVQSTTDAFFRYLSDHLSDNGSDETGYFQPLPRGASRLSAEKEKPFREGLLLPLDSPGWRRAWIARDNDVRIIGHVDLRARPENCAEHRCLLGMGVDRCHRNLGLAKRLLDEAKTWAVTATKLEWIDLQVLSVNARAVRLYLSAGFFRTGEVPEMFKLDERLFSYTSMTARIR